MVLFGSSLFLTAPNGFGPTFRRRWSWRVQPAATISGRPLPAVGRDFFTIVRHTRWPRVSSMTTARRRTWRLTAIALSGLLMAAPAQAIGTTDGTATALPRETDGDAG